MYEEKEKMPRDFKGIWIPKQIWVDTRLNALDKIILAEIDSLDNPDKGCFASNKYLAEFCQCSESKITRSVSKLIKIGYLYVEKFDGRTRILRSRLIKMLSEPSQIAEAGLAKSRHINIDNNKATNIEDNNIRQSKIDEVSVCQPKQNKNHYESEFEKVWEEYPKKQGRQNALKAYIKARKDGISMDTVLNGLNAYNAYLKANNVGERYIKQGSTWFNQRCWDDEYDVKARPAEERTPDGKLISPSGEIVDPWWERE